MVDRVYTAEPTLVKFHADSKSVVRCVMGNIGSGKSVACAQEIFARAVRQAPNKHGRRRTRWAIIRQTYPELISTTIKTWQDWFPHNVCPITFGAPIMGHMCFNLSDKTILDMEILFLAMNIPKDAKKVLSLEITGAWLNEAREVDKSIVDAVIGRTGRFPAKMDGAPLTWSGVIMDTNPPDETHWWYRLAEETPPEDLPGWKFYRQPPALIEVAPGKYKPNPHAENVRHQQLGYDYWMRQVPGKTREWIKVYLQGEYGTIMAGKPIYEGQWADSAHVAEVEMIAKTELVAGWDWGLTPAFVLGQVTPTGRLEILDELIGENIGAEQFAQDFVLPFLARRYPGRHIVHVGDPAGMQKSQVDERSVFEALYRMGIKLRPAPTQNPLDRIEAVRWFLGRMCGGKPGFALSPRCKMLRKAFNGGYRFRQLQVAGSAQYSDKPDKNEFSHVSDALQYLCSHLRHPYLKKANDNERPLPRYRPAEAIGGY